jgi:ABC-type transport system involved in multi-copper enzyme maturation permease subunit
MTASTSNSLHGFRPFLRKEVFEWWQRRAALVTFLVVSGLGIVGTLATRIDELAGGVPTAAELDPTANVLNAQFDQWILFAGIFASIGMLITERVTGTLAWTLSKPISRSSVLVAKWFGALIMLIAFAVILPLAVSVAVATWSYGGVPDLATVARFGLVLIALPAFFVALNLAVATRIDSQAAVAAIAFAVVGAPYLIGSFVPGVAELWPTSIAAMAAPFAIGEPANLPTVASWAISLVVIGLAGLLIFNREDM